MSTTTHPRPNNRARNGLRIIQNLLIPSQTFKYPTIPSQSPYRITFVPRPQELPNTATEAVATSNVDDQVFASDIPHGYGSAVTPSTPLLSGGDHPRIQGLLSTDTFAHVPPSPIAPPSPTIIVFGSAGAGKSSVMNMLRNSPAEPENRRGGVALVGPSANGVTSVNEVYQKRILEQTFSIYDTVGLNESPNGTVAPIEAIKSLYLTMRQLENGINLLVYVVRGPRITENTRKNYEIFHDIFCQKKVKVVLLVTGLEAEENMDDWWEQNKHSFTEDGMNFAGAGCITASKGKFTAGEWRYEDEYRVSQEKVERLIRRHYQEEAWKMPLANWFTQTVVRLASVLGLNIPIPSKALQDALIKSGVSEREARDIAAHLERSLVLGGGVE